MKNTLANHTLSFNNLKNKGIDEETYINNINNMTDSNTKSLVEALNASITVNQTYIDNVHTAYRKATKSGSTHNQYTLKLTKGSILLINDIRTFKHYDVSKSVYRRDKDSKIKNYSSNHGLLINDLNFNRITPKEYISIVDEMLNANTRTLRYALLSSSREMEEKLRGLTIGYQNRMSDTFGGSGVISVEKQKENIDDVNYIIRNIKNYISELDSEI